MSHVSLRDAAEGDLPILFEQQLDPEANEMAAFPARDRAAFVEHWTKILADETVVKKAILFDRQVAGNIVVAVHNIAPIRALEKCGFTQTNARLAILPGRPSAWRSPVRFRAHVQPR